MIKDQLETQGYAIVHDVLSPEFIKLCKAELAEAIRIEDTRYGQQAGRHLAMVLLCSLYGGTFTELFDNAQLMAPFNAVLGDNSIVYAYTSSSMPPGGGNYSVRIHVDSPRLIPGYVTNMGATITLDEFSEQNGATYFLPGSHTRPDPPSRKEFLAGATRFVAPPGSVLFFNARLWHSGGVNQTEHWRHALTLNMCRSYMKQRIDIPRAMAWAGQFSLSEVAKQKLGFYSQPPSNLDEYYLPLEQRSFRQPAE